jgi:hypothetical protein
MAYKEVKWLTLKAGGQSSAALDAKSTFLIFKYIQKTILSNHLPVCMQQLPNYNLSNPPCLIYTNICFDIGVVWFIMYFKDLNEPS